MRALYGVIAAVALVLTAPYAIACKCAPPPPPKEALAGSSAVFSGKVIQVEQNGRRKQVTFEVDRAWKGVDAARVVVSTATDSAACGVSFEQGKSYLVYCHGQGKELSTSLCTRTKTLDSADEDLKDLGEGQRR
ncbi:MAG: hypothetical protein K8T25_07460 [Planctomycetia bacterium]|nr:hypothetical protein [Planctomycetia bacterium]